MPKRIFDSKKAASLLKKSQKRIDSLRKRLDDLTPKRSKKSAAKELPKPPKKELPEVKISISTTSVIKATVAIFLLLGLVQFLGIIQGTIIIFLVSLFLSITLAPGVDRLHRYKIPRSLAVIIIYLLVIGVFVVLFSNLIPILVDQIEQIARSLQSMIQNLANGSYSDFWLIERIQPYLDQILSNINQADLVSQVSGTLRGFASSLGGFAGNAWGAILAVFNGVLNLFLVLVITFFMILHSKESSDFFHSLFPHRYSAYISQKGQQISTRIGEWVRGQLLLALAMGLLTFILLSIVGIDYALTLSLVSALGEFIPYFGPIITFVSASLIALNQEFVLFLWLIPTYIIIQFVEGNMLVPLIVGRSVGLNPVVVMFALFTGASVGYSLGNGIGLAIVGMIVAVPTANIISLFVEDYTHKKK